MAQGAQILKGYVKTSNMYLIALVTLSIGFLGGVLFSSYRMASMAPVPQGEPASQGMPGGAPAAQKPMTKAQSDALAALLQATQATPDNVKAWTQLGHLYFDLDKNEKAIEAYEKSLAIDPNRPDVWTDLGVMYRRAGNSKKSVESFDRALSFNSRHEVALFNKGVVLMHDLNDQDAAITAWKTLVKINPNAQAPNGQLIRNMVAGLQNQ
jgi:tetratricopeptide (TPR) repeat protein